MKYVSTRGCKDEFSPSEAIIKGLASDGGLFVPKAFPEPFKSIEALGALKELSYTDLAYEIMKHFIDDFSEAELRSCINSAYDSKFDDERFAPLVKAGGEYFLELFHGRTLAFKDMALSILPYLMQVAKQKTGMTDNILILTATSGDTGKAAMEGFKDVDGISLIVFYPQNGVSKVQELQMSTQEGKNLHAVAIKGNFDDCQTAVKTIFADDSIKAMFAEKGIAFSSANSINIGRLIPQIVYYFYGYFQIVASGAVKLGEKINFCVPTGNFGNILAGYYAKKMGLPIDKLICASNKNKVLFDFLESGKYDRNRELYLTNSPSMDILVSSNLERLLFELKKDETGGLMSSLSESGSYAIDRSLAEKAGIIGSYASEEMCLEAIAELYDEVGYVMDTHTAVAYYAYNALKPELDAKTKTIIISTASPYKFVRSVLTAIDETYEGQNDFDLIKELSHILAEEVPEQIRDLDRREVLHSLSCGKDDIKDIVIKLGLI